MVKANYLMHERMKDVENANKFLEAVASSPMQDSPVRSMLLSEVPAAARMSSQGKKPRPLVDIDMSNVIAVARSQVAINSMRRGIEVNIPEEHSSMTDDDIARLPWGTKHPDRERGPDQRACWTPYEVQFIGQWVDQARAQYPSMKQVISKCRDALVTEYPEMIQHFHVHHVISPARFSHGYKLYNQAK